MDEFGWLKVEVEWEVWDYRSWDGVEFWLLIAIGLAG